MSFRIEDILKKDNPKFSYLSLDCPVSPPFSRVFEDRSFAERTLLYRNDKMEYSDYLEKDYLSPNGQIDKSIEYFYDFYNDSGYPYSVIQKYWARHRNSTAPIFFPLEHYSTYSKRKGGQIRFSVNQTETLEKKFNSHKYLSPEDRKMLANDLKLSDRQVKTWFQNRRAKWRRFNYSPMDNLTPKQTK